MTAAVLRTAHQEHRPPALKSASRGIFPRSPVRARRAAVYGHAAHREIVCGYGGARQARHSLQTDPIGAKDDPNLYMYVGNDPLNQVDPTGMEGAAMTLWASRCQNQGQCGPLPGPSASDTRAFGNFVADSTPVLGDLKGFGEFFQRPSWGGFAAAMASILPGGDSARPLVREGVDDAVDVFVDALRHPEAARHIDEAQAAGRPAVLTIERTGADARRAEATAGHPTASGMDRDEYPPAFTAEGGAGASVRSIPAGDNRGAGACIGNQCRALPDGTKIRVRTR